MSIIKAQVLKIFVSKMNSLLFIFFVSSFLRSNAAPLSEDNGVLTNLSNTSSLNGNKDILNTLSNADPVILFSSIPALFSSLDQEGFNSLSQIVGRASGTGYKNILQAFSNGYNELSSSNQVVFLKKITK